MSFTPVNRFKYADSNSAWKKKAWIINQVLHRTHPLASTHKSSKLVDNMHILCKIHDIKSMTRLPPVIQNHDSTRGTGGLKQQVRKSGRWGTQNRCMQQSNPGLNYIKFECY